MAIQNFLVIDEDLLGGDCHRLYATIIRCDLVAYRQADGSYRVIKDRETDREYVIPGEKELKEKLFGAVV